MKGIVDFRSKHVPYTFANTFLANHPEKGLEHLYNCRSQENTNSKNNFVLKTLADVLTICSKAKDFRTEETRETKMREGPTRTYYKNWDYRSLQPIIVKQTPAGKPLVKLRMTDKFVPEV